MRNYFYIIVLIISQNALCQNTFLKYYNKFNAGDKISSFDKGQQLMEVDDGYIVFGWKEERTIGATAPFSDTIRPLIMKVDKKGNVLWNKRYDNNTCSFGIGGSVKNSANEIISVGTTLMPGDSCGYWPPEITPIVDIQIYLQKIDPNGNIIWKKNIGETVNKSPQGADVITSTKDGNYFVLGSDSYFTWLLKINENGDTLWTKKYPSLYDRYSRLITRINDGYLIFSYSGPLVSKINDEGDLLWTKSIPFQYDAIKLSKKGGFILSRTYKPNATIFTILSKLDNEANINWERTYSTASSWAISEAGENNFISAYKDFSLLSLSGEILWNKRFWGPSNITPWYYFLDVIQTSDGGFLGTGFYEKNTFLIKTDCEGNIEWDTRSCLLQTEKSILVFPNPFNENITFQLPEINKDVDRVSISISDLLGRVVFSSSYENQNIVTLNLSTLSQSIYIYSIFVNNKPYKSDKLIKQ